MMRQYKPYMLILKHLVLQNVVMVFPNNANDNVNVWKHF